MSNNSYEVKWADAKRWYARRWYRAFQLIYSLPSNLKVKSQPISDRTECS